MDASHDRVPLNNFAFEGTRERGKAIDDDASNFRQKSPKAGPIFDKVEGFWLAGMGHASLYDNEVINDIVQLMKTDF